MVDYLSSKTMSATTGPLTDIVPSLDHFLPEFQRNQSSSNRAKKKKDGKYEFVLDSLTPDFVGVASESGSMSS